MSDLFVVGRERHYGVGSISVSDDIIQRGPFRALEDGLHVGCAIQCNVLKEGSALMTAEKRRKDGVFGR